jgi:tRNA dimethylallyltransferase
LAGGTGLYVKALLEGYQFNDFPGDEKLRSELTDIAEKQGKEYLHAMLMKVDPITANRLHPNDIRRIIRALEVHYTAGISVSQDKAFNQYGLIYDVAVIALTMDRAFLYDRINKRVDAMLSQGLIAEVERLLNNGVLPQYQAMQGIGYKEIVTYLSGQTDLSTAIENIKKATRHFAKRQLTWYRRMPYIHWVDIDNFANYDTMFTYIYKYIAGKFDLK